MRYLAAFLILGIVVLFHEFGHFLLAKKNGITVTEFAFGMGPKLLSFKKNGTVYAWKLLPFGGSCSMLGEDEDANAPGSFNNAHVLRRISVVAAGPVFNFILALIFSLVSVFAFGADPAVVTEVDPASPAAEAGLAAGDRIAWYEGNGIANARELYFDIMIDEVPTDEVSLAYMRDGKKVRISYTPQTVTRYMLGFYYESGENGALVQQFTSGSVLKENGMQMGDEIVSINGTTVKTLEDLQSYLEVHPLDGSPIDLMFLRNGREHTLTGLRPVEHTTAALGFGFNMASERMGFLQSVRYGFGEVSFWRHYTFKSIISLVNGTFGVNEMSGPVGFVSTVGDVYEEAAAVGVGYLISTLLSLLILLSANLGVMNLLPIPALDGGRLLLMLVELVRGKPLNREIEGRIHIAGFLILMAFMLYITVHDIMKLF